MLPRLVEFGNDDLEAQIASLKDELQAEKDKVTTLTDEVSIKDDTINALNSEKATLSAENNALSKGNSEKKDEFVCFSRTTL